jgi:isopenicillin N synthase-like dioxygenase
VTNLTGQERYSIPFFFGVDYNATVAVLPNFITADRPACREPFKAGEVSNGTQSFIDFWISVL